LKKYTTLFIIIGIAIVAFIIYKMMVPAAGSSSAQAAGSAGGSNQAAGGSGSSSTQTSGSSSGSTQASGSSSNLSWLPAGLNAVTGLVTGLTNAFGGGSNTTTDPNLQDTDYTAGDYSGATDAGGVDLTNADGGLLAGDGSDVSFV